MATIKRRALVRVEPERAWGLWTDPSRWPAFVEGFKHVERRSGEWPEERARLEWVSTPGGRGRVTERVVESEPPRKVVTQIYEDAMQATQRIGFDPADEPGATTVDFVLEYRLTQAGFLRQLTDVLFIRRALAAAIDRTLRRFVTEAEEEAAL